MELLKPLV